MVLSSCLLEVVVVVKHPHYEICSKVNNETENNFAYQLKINERFKSMTAIEIHMKHETLARLNGMRVWGLFFEA